MNIELFAQSGGQLPEFSEVSIPAEASINILDLALKGGWIMGVLLLLSLLATFFFIQRFRVIRSAGKEDSDFMVRIRDYVREGKKEAALDLCRNMDTPAARMLAKGIARIGRPSGDVQAAIESAGNHEVATMERGIPVIATIAAGAPMVGFLGTVTGMIRAFYDMANAGASVDITLLSGGIYEALVTTVGGLVVGILALFAHNYLVAQVDGVINRMELSTTELMDLLNEAEPK